MRTAELDDLKEAFDRDIIELREAVNRLELRVAVLEKDKHDLNRELKKLLDASR